MDYQRVCAIDAGTRNFAYCVMDNMSWNRPLVWRHEDLWAPKVGRRGTPNKQDIVKITYEWCVRNRDMIAACDAVVLENQMRRPFIIMNTVLQTCFYGKALVVHPMTVGSFFKLPKTRQEKKEQGVELVKRFATIPNHAKRDDLADAWLMAAWQLVQSGALSSKYFLAEGLTETKK